MAAFLKHANNAASTLGGAVASGATSLTIQSGDTGLFPSSGNFEVTMWPAGQNPTAANSEIVLVTGGQGTSTLTITRAQEGTSAKNFSTSDNVALLMTAKQLTDIEAFLPIGTRVTAITSSATPTPNADTTDLYDITALGAAATITNPTGTPVNGQKLIIRIKDNGTIRALTWDTAFVAGGVALPTTTVTSKILTVGFIYNTANSLNKWMCVASAQEA